MAKRSKVLKKTTPIKRQLPTKTPDIEPGLVHVAFLPDDLKTFANLLSVTAKMYEKIALEAAQTNDDTSFTVLQARYKLTTILAEKLIAASAMPEPISRELH